MSPQKALISGNVVGSNEQVAKARLYARNGGLAYVNIPSNVKRHALGYIEYPCAQ